ncbi:ParB/RepB/Spo0J family partition protein [Desulfovibrio aerotolerans]|uniref:ParB/RepB/Spo0J family partition protein n=1 Tax=Solidesulfovibrio aerotolerans TaxID=295255 RepID=A0A7C9ITR1_9BACT|nr:ParB/RepB/Spo0J family partition protein [Solidesulfovibrio aerotolerans]MYL82720.1 ParB/RepB/Spo0J family partition protein [Solidesulfovibrio aerotolerans]
MAQAQKGLGRGLEALLGGYQDEREAGDILTLALDAIRANPEQPRRAFADDALAELADSIRAQGVLQPVLVRPVSGPGQISHEIVAGERRWRAARLAGLTEIPALIRDVDDETGFALALVENLQREDLNPMEEAAGYQLLVSRFGLSQDALAKKVGKSRSAVANALRLNALAEPMRQDLAEGRLTAGHARALLSLPEGALRDALWQRVVTDGLSVREAEAAAGYAKQNGCLPGAGDAPAAETPPKRSAKPAVDARLVGLEALLTERAGVLVKTGGTADHGKLTFHFSSRRELEGLLERFNLQPAALGDEA